MFPLPKGLLICSAALLIASAASNAQEVRTDPVGFTKITIPGAPAGAGASASAIVSFSLQPSAIFTGVASSVGTADAQGFFSVTSSQAAWTAALTNSPHLVKVTSGPAVGRFFVISQVSSATQLVLDSEAEGAGGFADGHSFQVTPMNTIGSVFGTNPPSLHADEDPTLADNILIWDGSQFRRFYHDTTQWSGLGVGAGDQKNAKIYPDAAVFVIRKLSAPVEIFATGAVPTTQLQTRIPGTGGELLGNRFPVATTLASLGLQNVPGWTSGEDPAAVDNLLFWNGLSYDRYWYDNTPGVEAWQKIGSGASQNATLVPEGAGFFIRRGPSAGGGSRFITHQRPYSL